MAHSIEQEQEQQQQQQQQEEEERGRRRRPSTSSSASSTKSKSSSIPVERSNSVSFSCSEKKKSDPSNVRKPSEIETPQGPVPRPEAGAAPVASWQEDNNKKKKKEWPKEWRAYVCLFGGFLLMFNSWGLVNAYGTYSSHYMQSLLSGRDLLLMNLVGSTQSGVVLSLSTIVGRLLDAGYIRQILIVGTILLSLGSFLLSVVNGDGLRNQGNYGLTWLTQGLISGLGMACFFVSSSQVVATWFIDRKSLAIGIVASGASIAGLLYPMMIRFLIDGPGFNIATRWVAAVTTLTSCLAIICCRPNPKHIFRKPEAWRNMAVFWDKNAFQEPAYAFLVAAIAFLFFGFYAVFFNLEEWAVSEGFGFRPNTGNVGENIDLPEKAPAGSIETFWLLAILNGTSTLGRIGSAYLSDKYGALNVHAVVTLVGSLLVLILWTLSHSLSSALAFVVIFGAFSGAVIGLPPASVAYVLGKDPHRQAKLGQWTGMMYSCASVSALTGPVIAGHLITEYNTYITVQVWAGATMFLSSMCMCCAVYFKRRHDSSSSNHFKRIFSSATTVGGGGTSDEKV